MFYRLAKYFLTLLLVLLPAALWAQGTIYTKSARLADFPQKTTKIVLSGQELLDDALKEEITSRWRISPYEFCSEEEFQATRTVSRYYYLHFIFDDEFTWMQLYKGGPASGNPLRTAMEVVSVPVASSEEATMDELVFLPAFIDMVQEYLLKALVSDKVSYQELKGIITKSRKGKFICNDEKEGRELFASGAKGTIIPIVVWGTPTGKHRHYWRMRVSTDDHLLYEYRRKRVRVQ